MATTLNLTGSNLDFNSGPVDDNAYRLEPPPGYSVTLTTDPDTDATKYIEIFDRDPSAGTTDGSLIMNIAGASTPDKPYSSASITTVLDQTISNHWTEITYSNDAMHLGDFNGINMAFIFVDMNDDGVYNGMFDLLLDSWDYATDWGLSTAADGTWNNYSSTFDLSTLSAANRAAINGHQIGFSIIASENASGGAVLGVDNVKLVVALCFARGAQIETDRGVVLIEDLREGDLVLTMDHDFQPIRWIGKRILDKHDLRANPKLRPVSIKAHALASNIPAHDLALSPQHRVLISSKIAERMVGSREILTPAIKLTDHTGIHIDLSCETVEYYHILFDRHEVIYANRMPCESFYLGKEAVKSLHDTQVEEIQAIFPDLLSEKWDQISASRPVLANTSKVKSLVTRHAKNKRVLLDMTA